MVDGVSVKSTNVTDSRAISDIGNNYYRWGLPDSPGAKVGIARYDAEGNVTLKIFKSDLSTVLFDGPIGKVSVEGLPGKYGEDKFGTAIEQRVNELVTKATGQPHFWKNGSTNGVDFQPQFPPEELRHPAANDNATK